MSMYSRVLIYTNTFYIATRLDTMDYRIWHLPTYYLKSVSLSILWSPLNQNGSCTVDARIFACSNETCCIIRASQNGEFGSLVEKVFNVIYCVSCLSHRVKKTRWRMNRVMSNLYLESSHGDRLPNHDLAFSSIWSSLDGWNCMCVSACP